MLSVRQIIADRINRTGVEQEACRVARDGEAGILFDGTPSAHPAWVPLERELRGQIC